MTEDRAQNQIVQDLDVMVPMRDGARLAVDVFRPAESGKYPVLYACALHNKDMQHPGMADVIPPQPAHSSLWFGPIEAGDTRRLLKNGYVHVIAQSRGVGKSEGEFMQEEWDHYDLIEWIVAQPWCDGSVGMIGISAFAGEQWRSAAQQHPNLKAIFPYDACSAYGEIWGFRDFHPGGVIQTMPYLLDVFSCVHESRGIPQVLPEPHETWWKEAMANPDYKMYANLYNILTQKGQRSGLMYQVMVDPYEDEATLTKAEEKFKKIQIPFYTGSGAYAYTYKMHWQGAQHYFQNCNAPKKLIFTGPAHVERPFHSYHDEIIRWFDHWLKGKQTGIMDEPAVKYWVMGANKWRTGADWPLPETQWKKMFLSGWERLTEEAPEPSSHTSNADNEPDSFVQMPLTKTRKIQKLRYMTDPLPEDLLVAGPISLTLYAAIDDDDTNWIVVLKDVGPDVSVVTAREGERDVPTDLKERELTRGWLKASYRALDEARSKPWAPFHKLTREARKPVVPGEINEYKIEILSTANQFNKGHRICLEIMSMDVPTGVCAMTNVEYAPYHICRSKTVVHKVYHTADHPSHLLLPIIPAEK
ncbi:MULTISPECIES: CocE/NonD family hydrolase [unclassified Bradyrhizobium]|uniref:CocE/NonD family hydrolase n=1 Tax=unclassified Bradyrhizobium TaxID=2631580 RepID=UPI0024798D5E|nr:MULTISPECIES: CocE/NonD family hydrolase [unclassified Bradyrhizobium]WGR73120.1 CocE/NonD family hydrolase [Bradyrhizobium sp. ISRA426]WGR77960.1 CocE/NonD family hydrolase [Bradyrhizobium sp. ISRA430]WGR88361.1 CocE/NonD family hydrolase [Bradyrhizobium sp. ISRA432]